MANFSSIVEIIAPAATIIAACMTAANLGPRVTGYGFIIFTVGSIAWSYIAISTGQTALLLTNGFLTAVNVVGIWRWLGRIARFNDGAQAAETKSRHADTPELFDVGTVQGRPVIDGSGVQIGSAVGMMAESGAGAISYLVVSSGGVGGIGERLVALRWQDIQVGKDALSTQHSAHDLSAMPALDPTDWPAHLAT